MGVGAVTRYEVVVLRDGEEVQRVSVPTSVLAHANERRLDPYESTHRKLSDVDAVLAYSAPDLCPYDACRE